MKILVAWHTGTRNRSSFRMMLSTGVVEKHSLDMLGMDQWVAVNVQPKDVETVRQRSIESIATAYLNTTLLDVSKRAVNAKITTSGPGSAALDIMIDLGEVVMS